MAMAMAGIKALSLRPVRADKEKDEGIFLMSLEVYGVIFLLFFIARSIGYLEIERVVYFRLLFIPT